MQPLVMKQMKEQISNYIRTKILKGEYPEGFELVQENIAAELGVSRMPVREALQILEQEGYIERMRNRHMRVVGLSKQSIETHGRLLAATSAEIGLMMIEHQVSLEPLRRAWKSLKDAAESGNDSGTLARLELNIHRQLRLEGMGSFVTQQQERMLSAYWIMVEMMGRGDHRGRISLLGEIVDAIEAGVAEGLHAQLRAYYDNVTNALIEDDSNE